MPLQTATNLWIWRVRRQGIIDETFAGKLPEGRSILLTCFSLYTNYCLPCLMFETHTILHKNMDTTICEEMLCTAVVWIRIIVANAKIKALIKTRKTTKTIPETMQQTHRLGLRLTLVMTKQ
ncbi:unnamed protein product [Brassica napus]|uniref:(rape) hypothetical protein n=1 Tax=Brassica napus TaxID=3708 RepID=A0A817AUK1_BRANA|nr:unnamed protein product [Brassica napus]